MLCVIRKLSALSSFLLLLLFASFSPFFLLSHSNVIRLSLLSPSVAMEKNESSFSIRPVQILIHEADPQPRPVMIIVFALVVRPYVSSHFSKQNKSQVKTMFATSETLDLAEGIIDDTCLVDIYVCCCMCLHFRLQLHCFCFSVQKIEGDQVFN